MRTSMILALLLFFATVPATAQSTPGHKDSQFRFPSDTMACPVSLRADRRANIVSREVDGKPIPSGQGLMLHFLSKPAVVSADIIVHGYAGGVIAQPLTVTSQSEVAEKFHLTGSSSDPLIQPSIWTEKIHGITWLELTRVSFSDGTSWSSGVQSKCRIEPSLFVLVK
jgi:hypothetical protein